MRSFLTTRAITSMALLAGLLLVAAPASAQEAPEMGEEFILFVNGANRLIPSHDATVVQDPADIGSTNRVARFNYGEWADRGFRWDNSVGIDMSANVERGDGLNIRIWSHPDNAGKPNIQLLLLDREEGEWGQSREDLESGAAEYDFAFRASWPIPDEWHDGEWHDVFIPLPPATYAELEAAKDAGTLDENAERWEYPGAWAGFGGIGPGWGGDTSDPLWEEFQWEAVRFIGVMWDNNAGGGPIYLDDVFVGNEDTDISLATQPVEQVSSVAVAAVGEANEVTWSEVQDADAYRIYVSESPITDVDDPEVVALGSVSRTAEELAYSHRFEVPHASLAPFTLHYAVTTMSPFGVENLTTNGNTIDFTNPNLSVLPYIAMLTDEQTETLFDAVASGEVGMEGFPEGLRPFVVNQERYATADMPTPPDDDNDLSVQVWMGLSSMNELFIYTEVLDDSVRFGGIDRSPGESWQFDSIEFGLGSYDVREVEGGSVFLGSPYQDLSRGTTPDYQFRVGAFQDAEGEVAIPYAFYHTGGGPEGEISNAGNVEVMTDNSGNRIGWRALALFPLTDLPGLDETVMSPPASEEIAIIPMIISINDHDGGEREHQLLSSLKWNLSGNWWNTPAEWTSVAIVGTDLVGTSSGKADLPQAYTLSQNYPNPFNPSTIIEYSLGRAGSVTLEVFNVLGQRVAVLVDGREMAAGPHAVAFDASRLSSGVYYYSLKSGDYKATKQMLLVK